MYIILLYVLWKNFCIYFIFLFLSVYRLVKIDTFAASWNPNFELNEELQEYNFIISLKNCLIILCIIVLRKNQIIINTTNLKNQFCFHVITLVLFIELNYWFVNVLPTSHPTNKICSFAFPPLLGQPLGRDQMEAVCGGVVSL